MHNVIARLPAGVTPRGVPQRVSTARSGSSRCHAPSGPSSCCHAACCITFRSSCANSDALLGHFIQFSQPHSGSCSTRSYFSVLSCRSFAGSNTFSCRSSHFLVLALGWVWGGPCTSINSGLHALSFCSFAPFGQLLHHLDALRRPCCSCGSCCFHCP